MSLILNDSWLSDGSGFCSKLTAIVSGSTTTPARSSVSWSTVNVFGLNTTSRTVPASTAR